ncbi:hypothetical protein AVDCRST_MAG92-3133 [uncultured Coleofasciculus sp.]|uniref:Uncharacterized protein n=1 Tax=uncultured Coleofasciculus sp. TaxID=1267456 RepID=A0A6J4JD01_9CYAN|nr:hypothetical protein AVDCRST_MAG92-3133 [uncultured Coleofasciculus sp.]
MLMNAGSGGIPWVTQKLVNKADYANYKAESY